MAQKKTLVFSPIEPNPIRTDFIELFGGRDGLWYSHIKARNGQITYVSEGYEKYHAALKTAKKQNLKIYVL